MIKALQKRFIIISMTAITALLVVLLSGINLFNITSVSKQNANMLDVLASSGEPFQMMRPDGFKDERKPENDRIFQFKPPEEDRKQAAIYFKICVDSDGEIIRVDTSKIPSVTESEAKDIYSAANSSEGKTGKFIFKTRTLPDNLGKEVFFLSTSEQNYSVLRVALLSFGVGVICWCLMLLIIVLLSRKAIRPIAENIEKQKQFITDAGHEIKTPLAIIMANTEALELHNGESKWTSNIKNQTLRLNGLMQNLLLLAKATNGETPIKKENFDFSEVIKQTADGFSESAKVKNLSFDFDIAKEIFLSADKNQLTSLVSILIDNAVKYSSENTSIKINLKKDTDILFSVSNKCDSLPECLPENLFDRFYRGDTARTQKSGGYGIGLSAAKAIAELHGGSIEAKYLNENEIRFEVRF
ncbi:MAG: HAMP domain-containing histidine kinase [Clostridia bacterium]|nr:HAMP domain-containing histidine kinase [Clostridia bacterium]